MINQLTVDLVKIKRFIDKFEEGKLKLVDSIGNVYSKNNNFFYKLSLSDVLNETPLRSFYIDWLIESEKIFPNCSKELLKNLYNLHTHKSIDISYYRQHATKNDLIAVLKDFLSEEGINLFLTLLEISGPDSLLNVKPSNNHKIEIKKENLTKFDNIKCHEELSGILFSQATRSKRDVIFAAIDGFLERDTDLQPLYNESAANQGKMIVVLCRGTNLQCIMQIRKNIVYNKIPVLIYECPFINEDPLKFDDLCRCLNVLPVKIEDGDPTIVQIQKKLVKLENMILLSDGFEFECQHEISNRLVTEINEQLSLREEYKEYLNLRKKRIKSKKVNILIPKSKKNLIMDLNTAIFVYNSITKYGITVINDKKYAMAMVEISQRFAREFYQKLQNIAVSIKFKKEKKGRKNG
jgi:hypothetical protein